ncbi:ABC-2 type transport system ATP-binding protein [Paenibacillus turicensis]|uniref:ABC-2 type transport system ATP-binding protein n=1 Tax=Paenibacillus turicensis TaxID=160487 RepID=A0ABS4FWK0_9BACL|nr:ATP-binding cassette domain-containing protein [Paenibacillus turicensis]MBP1906894.1 ABC-2 type transport system ATP-binding protein [Paenibacillus turicensis]
MNVAMNNSTTNVTTSGKSPKSAISVRNVTKVLAGQEVISNCTMNVPEGKIYGFLGANGAGKTTMMKMITGLMTPTQGVIEVLGKEMSNDRNEILKEILKETGSLIEVPVFFEHLDMTENLALHLEYMDVQGDNGVKHTRIANVLQKVGLQDSAKLPVSKLSLGMRQRLAIARAILHQPKLLILDEPLNGLDPMGIRDMRTLFRQLVEEQHMTILISSHIISELEQVADVVGIISNGALLQEADLCQVRAQYSGGLEQYFMTMVGGNNGGEIIA